MENGSETIKTGHDQVETVVYSPDATMIATGGDDPLPSTPEVLSQSLTGGKLVTKHNFGGVWQCFAWLADR